MSSVAVQGRDRYGANPAANLSSSPPSSRRAGRQTSGGIHNASLPTTPQQAQFSSSGGVASMTSSHAQQMSPSSSAADGMASSTYSQYYPDQSGSGTPMTALPIRTSQPPSQSSPAATYDSPRYGSRSQQSHTEYGSETDRGQTSDGERRRDHRSPRQSSGQSDSSRGQRRPNPPTQSRSTNAIGATPLDTSLPRENSAIINHIVVDDPRTDIARERARVAEAVPGGDTTPISAMAAASEQAMSDSQRSAPTPQRRQTHLGQPSSHRKEVKFGDYILGQTLGEGEFGKVKMGWKKDSTVQVAIKLIRKETLAGNNTRLPKIYREISILKELQHPNIVRLHEFVETERHMGIILEYASGGELFDYILNHRYLKDPAARRLFAQLVSGVGYLHKKGIVHRDLKLENLLLDRNKNIIITDFGFANTFNPGDELGDELEGKITNKQFVKDQGLDVIQSDGHRRGDLMQTSCGSPCYAAPELVVSDGLYTGKKVDVWSCGVILYAMLAGYLPFDDDPANPEGDNINLLYKYIVSTPLTFPEYVTPHARDLLRRILVPDPRRRADLFEVARHSWLSEYSHVVGFIGSTTKSDRDIATSALSQDDEPVLGRSASVREPASRSPAVGVQKQPVMVGDDTQDARNKQRDAKRRTVQVEYVAPNAATARGEGTQSAAQTAPVAASFGRTRARGDSQGPVEVTSTSAKTSQAPRKDVPSPLAMPPPTKTSRDQTRSTSDSTAFSGYPTTSASRPTTGGTLGGGSRLPSRGNSYSQPVAATPTTANAQGHFSQPKPSTGYIISSPIPSDQGSESTRPQSQQNFAQFQQQARQQEQQQQQQQQPAPQRGHKRSSTLGSIGDRLLGRSNSKRSQHQQESAAAPTPPPTNEKRDRKYPPVSMRNTGAMNNGNPNNNTTTQPTPRTSTESRRPSFSLLRKNSDQPSERRSSRRFSFLPNSFSMNNFGGGGGGGKKDTGYDSAGSGGNGNGAGNPERRDSSTAYRAGGRPQSKGMAFGRGESRSPSQSTTNSTIPLYYEQERETARAQRRVGAGAGSSAVQTPQKQGQGQQGRYEKSLPAQPQQSPLSSALPRKQFRDDGFGGNALDSGVSTSQQGLLGHGQQQEPVERFYTPNEMPVQTPSQLQGQNKQRGGGGGGGGEQQYFGRQQQQQYQDPASLDDGYNSTTTDMSGGGGRPGGLQNMKPQQRKFENAYDQGHAGSSSGARRVMDFFRRRGKDRGQGV